MVGGWGKEVECVRVGWERRGREGDGEKLVGWGLGGDVWCVFGFG